LSHFLPWIMREEKLESCQYKRIEKKFGQPRSNYKNKRILMLISWFFLDKRIQWKWFYLWTMQKKKKIRILKGFFFLDSRKTHPPESAFCGLRWGSKTPAVPGSYKRCTPWLELETCNADPKPFAITLRPLGTESLKVF